MRQSSTLRVAKPAEADHLSDLAARSKAYWGYSAAFVDACRSELSVSSDDIQNPACHYVVAERAGKIIGFYGIERLSPHEFELDALFVEPQLVGCGIGRALIARAKTHIARAGGGTLLIQSDPNAEGFYRAMGAERIGHKASASFPGRRLPLLAIAIPAITDKRDRA
ncbi:MAG: GNAT family N-acetyltransferase [Cyanobacteria bacterium J06639_1]